MSDHVWAQDHVAASVVGGLTAEEAERFDGHVRDCPECTAAVGAARRLDAGMTSLFADVRPAVGLEDRAVRSTRKVRRRNVSLADRLPRWAVAAMILLALGTFGAMAERLMNGGLLPVPGGVAVASRVYRESPSKPEAPTFYSGRPAQS